MHYHTDIVYERDTPESELSIEDRNKILDLIEIYNPSKLKIHFHNHNKEDK